MYAMKLCLFAFGTLSPSYVHRICERKKIVGAFLTPSIGLDLSTKNQKTKVNHTRRVEYDTRPTHGDRDSGTEKNGHMFRTCSKERDHKPEFKLAEQKRDLVSTFVGVKGNREEERNSRHGGLIVVCQ